MNQLICSKCGTVGTPKAVTKGSILIEIVLWLCFIVPGVIYSIWRFTTRTQACRSCGAEQMVQLNSPMGKKLQMAATVKKCPFCAELIKKEANICRYCGKDSLKLPAPRPDTPVDLTNLEEAIKDYDKAIEINPEDARAYYSRGVTYGCLGNLNEATDDLKIAAGLGLEEAKVFLSKQGIAW